MPFLLFDDSFSRSGGIGSNYRETGFVPFVTTGTRLRLPAEAVAYTYPGGTGFYAAAGRAVQNSFDPKTFFPLEDFTTVSTYTPTLRVRYQVRFRLPDTAIGTGNTAWAGVIGGSNDVANQAGYEFLYYIDGTTNTHELRVGQRISNGTFNEYLPGRRDLTALGKELSPGEEATLFLEIVFNNMFVFEIHTWWDPQTQSSSGFFRDELHLWRSIPWPVVPTSAIPPGSYVGRGPDSLGFYGGVIVYQEGPATAATTGYNIGSPWQPAGPVVLSPPALTDFIFLDDFRITDFRDFSGERVFPKPVPSTPTTLTAVSVPAEANPSGSSLTVAPSFSVEIDEDWKTREHRSDDNTVETFTTQHAPRRTWLLGWAGISKSERDTLETLFESLLQFEKSFTWTHPETSEVLEVKPQQPPEFEQIAGQVWNARLLVQESF